MVELLAPRHTLVRPLAKRHAVDGLQVAGAAFVVVSAGVLGGLLGDHLQALVVARVRGQPAVLRRGGAPLGPGLVGGKTLLIFQGGDDIDHGARVVGAARQVLGAELVGLQLLLAAIRGHVTRRHGLRHLADRLPGARHALTLQHCAQQGGRQHAQAGVLLAGGALGTVARRHMPNFMADDPRQFGLTLHVRHDAARHIYIATGQRKGVDLRAVQHREVPLQLLAVRQLGQPLADAIHIGLQLGVFHHAVLLQHLGVRLAAFLHLVGLAHDRALGLARHRVQHRTATAGQQHRGQNRSGHPGPQGTQRSTHKHLQISRFAKHKAHFGRTGAKNR